MDTELNEDDRDPARWAVDAITRRRELEELQEQAE